MCVHVYVCGRERERVALAKVGKLDPGRGTGTEEMEYSGSG